MWILAQSLESLWITLSGFYRSGGARPQTEIEYRHVYGVEPICAVLPIAPSTHYRWKDHERHPEKRSHWVRRYEALKPQVKRGVGCRKTISDDVAHFISCC